MILDFAMITRVLGVCYRSLILAQIADATRDSIMTSLNTSVKMLSEQLAWLVTESSTEEVHSFDLFLTNWPPWTEVEFGMNLKENSVAQV